MRHLLLLLAGIALTAACGKVEGSRDGSPGDHRDDGGDVVVSDAAPPDATPVACDGPEDCMNPDDPCLLPGPCEGDVCQFAAVDCSELDGECTRGVCNDEGACEPRAIRQDMACGDGIMDCGGFGACGGFADDCDESGTESRSCRDSTCQSGTCETGAPYTDTRGCSRDTDGVGCGDTTVECSGDGVCNYTSTCDNDDTDVTCVQTDFSCAAGTCTPSETTTVDDCERLTECNPCTPTGGGQGVCSVGGSCISGDCQ